MKEYILTKAPYMNASEQRIADMHSVLNILNVIVGELSLIEPVRPDLRKQSSRLNDELLGISRGVKESSDVGELMSQMKGLEETLLAFAGEALQSEEDKPFSRTGEIEDSIANLESVFSILKTRLKEFDERAGNPDVWVQMEPDLFRQQLEEVFVAVAKNSKGKYGIGFDRAHQVEGDYSIDLKVEALSDDELLWIPLRLVDVFRDLTANARKYTAPGGHLTLSLHQDDRAVRAVIEDNGYGIPDDEIEKVAEFGYRATNVRRRPTFGGGYGLTKAVWLVTGWGGSFMIRSGIDQGTTIDFSFPNQEMPENPKLWKG